MTSQAQQDRSMRVASFRVTMEEKKLAGWKRNGNGKPAPPHGTRSRYNSRQCRCEDCRLANREYLRLHPKPASIPNHLHGTTNAYTHLGCRCDSCRTVATAARMAQSSKRCSVARCRRKVNSDGRAKYCDRCQEFFRINGHPRKSLQSAKRTPYNIREVES
jgi:hypothetical protein